MKKKFSINKSSLFSSFVICYLLFIICSCEQPFKAGLGPVIDLQDPTIVLEYPSAGAYIHDTKEFRGSAADDYKLDSVWFHISNYAYEELPLPRLPDAELQRIGLTGNYYRITPDTPRTDRKWTWKFKIDTMMLDEDGNRVFADGYLKIRLLAIDHVTKWVVTDEIVFNIKNNPPLISVDTPPIQEGPLQGDLGGESLNYYFLTARTSMFKRTVPPESDLHGMIDDREGVYRGPWWKKAVVAEDGDPIFGDDGTPILDSENKIKVDANGEPKTAKIENGQQVTVELFPPQIRFWEVYFDNWPLDKNGERVPEGTAYRADEMPTTDQVPWRNLKEVGSLIDTGGNSLGFSYFIPDASGHYFAFQVRAQSIDAMQSSTVYPIDYIDFDGKSDEFKQENSFVLVLVSEFQEDPILELYKLEDIYGSPKDGKPKRVNDIMTYNDLDIKEPEKSDRNYPYIDEDIVSRNGAFTLRMKASHSGGIASAKVYWEKANNKNEKGRFIWDPAELPYPTWPGAIPSKSAHYSTWGLNEPDGDTRVRSFVFTYTDLNPKGATAATATADRLDKNAIEFLNNVSGDIRNMSKIQQYTGKTSGQVSPDGKPYTLNDLPEDRGNWENVYKLEEGKYNIYVYALSNSGAPSPKPYRIELTIDRTRPSVALNYIEGSAGEEKINGEKVNTVNGVIQPWFIISEGFTGFHTGRPEEGSPLKDGYFHKPGQLVKPGPENYYDEQAYILIKETDRDTMDKNFAMGDYFDETKNIWPDFTKSIGGLPVAPNIPNVKVWKHGVIIDSVCRFRTSYIYDDRRDDIKNTPPGDSLEDGDYRLYVFARDNAFNVGRDSWPILVRRETDNPKFEFIGSSFIAGVTQPDSAYDFGGSKYTAANPESFIAANNVRRNIFTTNSAIEVRIKDDDSLDLGVEGGDDSGIEVTFIGSVPVVDPVTNVPELKPRPDVDLMTLGQPALKTAFNPIQTMEGGKRTAVKDSTGTITHDMLLDLLKHNQNYNSIFGADPAESVNPIPPTSPKNNISAIPDGVYRVGISIRDYSPAKLIMEPPFAPVADTAPADFVQVNIKNELMSPPDNKSIANFWIAIDSKVPVINITDEDKISGNIIPPNDPMDLKGTVSDENGPITLADWRVKNGSAVVSKMADAVIPAQTPRIIASQPVFKEMKDGKWVYEFSYKLDMNGKEEGTYDFEITFQDRFGNKTTKSLRSSGDNDPPKVSLTRKIETFSRNFDDVILEGVQKADAATNKGRLAVKVVNFAINATDANGVAGVHWWLLPADTGSSPDGFVTTGNGVGIVSGYDAFPAKQPSFDIEGVYYGNSANPSGFNKGVYGVMKVPTKESDGTTSPAKYIVAFDSRKLPSPNGEYRLHIIAKDKAGNCSSYTDNSISLPNVNVFQEVFFLQEEDKPYLDKGITPGYIDPLTAKEGLGWPTKIVNGVETADPVEMDVLGGAPIIRGTIWENNGFFQADGTTLAWPGSIVVWFSSGADLPSDWEAKVKSDPNTTASDIAGYTKIIIPNTLPTDAKLGIGKQGRNISLAIELSTLFPDEFKQDGKKRYIIRATDSPVNKLKELISYPGNYNTAEGNAVRRGVGLTDSDDGNTGVPGSPALTDVREFRYRQYAFVYDAIPPKVVIDTPVKKPVKTFGKTFASDFILGGYISDANLDKTADGDYYFDYYLNTEAKKTFTLKLRDGVVIENLPTDYPDAPPSATLPVPDTVPGKHIYKITREPSGRTTVYFRIAASEVTDDTPTNSPKGIIPESKFKGLAEGQHTLTLWAKDKGGKDGADWVDFIKDMQPPVIAFTNLTGNNKPYDSTNESRVDNKLPANNVNGWWSKTASQRQPFLLGGNPTPAPLPLTTISYDSGKPVLRGTIIDLVSNIDLKTRASTGATDPVSASGDINIDGSAFMYWIDNESSPRYLAVIDGKGTKSVRWTINLTKNGTIAADDPPLYDGVHTIVLTAADEAGEAIEEAQRYMIAFRIDSKPPRSAVSVTGIDTSGKSVVYGNVAYQNSGSTSMFTLDVTGDDANLEKVEMRIVNTTKTGDEGTKVTFTARDSATWTYYPAGTTLTITPPLPSPLTPPVPSGTELKEDYVLFRGTYPVPKTMFTDSGKYEVTVAAYDYARNKSEEFVFSFTYDKDKPGIEFTNPGDDTKNASAALIPQDFVKLVKINNIDTPETIEGVLTPNNNINRLTSQQLRIQGNVKDTFSAVRDVESRVEKWDWAARAWVQAEDWKPVKDYSANTQLQVAWTKNLLGQDTTETGGTGLDISKAPVNTDTVNNPLGEGLYRIRIRARDASEATPAPATNTFTTNWDNPVGSGTPAANGIGNPVFSDYVYFFYDRTDPTLEITGINGSATSMDTYYSKPKNGFTFEGTVTDNNRFAKVEVTFVSGAKTETKTAVMSKFNDTDPAISLNQGAIKQKWKAEFPDAANYPDGKYKVTVTVYDMTGRYTSVTKSFTLDSTPPTLKFTLPSKVQNKGYGDDSENKKPDAAGANGFASVLVNGGENAVITGVTDDKPGVGGESGSQSGVDQMWFHLGYIDGITDNTNYPFPTKAAIKAWEDTMILRYAQRVGTVPVDANGNIDYNPDGKTYTIGAANPAFTQANVTALSFKVRNAYMTEVAERRVTSDTDTTGNAWFKLGGTEKPTGFIIDNPNIYDWRFEIPNNYPVSKANADLTAMGIAPVTISGDSYYPIGGLKLYGNTIRIKGREYYVNPSGITPVRQMVRAVEGQAGGVYRLPLWVRVSDIAGNVEYYCHDIWIDTNGDIPTTTIESPSNASKANARGGTISVDGVARSNTSVYDVIFRVFADNESTTDLDGTSKTVGLNPSSAAYPHTTNLVKVLNYNTVTDTGVLNRIPTDYKTTDWQRANLTLTGGAGEPIIPWSIMLNSEDQIKNLISSRGFASAGSTNDMIRVWLEVFVFNGEGSPIRSSIYANDTLNTGGGALYGTASNTPPYYHPGPKPYVRAFYIRTGAAQITHPNVGNPSGSSFTWNPETPGSFGDAYYGYKGAGTETRSKQFAVKAILDPNPSNTSGSGLGEAAYRVKLDDGNYSAWTTAWSGKPNAQGNLEPALPGNTNGVRITRRTDTVTPAHGYRYDFIYAIDSTVAANSNDWAAINSGAWANTGGTVTVQIRIKDNMTPPNEAVQTIQVSVDNFAPLADSETNNTKVAGSNVDFQGRVFDYAPPTTMNTEYTPRKIDRIYAWFMNKSGQYANLTTGTWQAAPAGMRSMSAYTGRKATVVKKDDDSITSITITAPGAPAAKQYPPANDAWIREISQNTSGPGTGMVFSPFNSADYDVRWSFNINSATQLPDGDVILCYLVVDAAGNASYFEQTYSVRNKYPVIDKITLYTDNNGQGAAYTQDDTTEYYLSDYESKMNNNQAAPDTTGYLNSGFISKNKYIGFRVETQKGNNNLNFRLQHVTREPLTLDAAGLAAMKTTRDAKNRSEINLYTIRVLGDYSSAKWKAIGVPLDGSAMPSVGTHFVYNPIEGFNAADYVSATAQVWKYTLVGADTQRNDVTVTRPAGDLGTVVLGGPGVRSFEFNGRISTDNPTSTWSSAIVDKYGSHPDFPTSDQTPDNPLDTAFFLIRVWDTVKPSTEYTTNEDWVNDMLYGAVVVGMNIFVTDKNKPTARLYDLNPYTEPAVTGNNIGDANKAKTIENAADPQAIGSNIVRGGLFNTNTVREMVKSGYIDPRNGSYALSPKNSEGLPAAGDMPLRVSGDQVTDGGDTRDKVSGKIILRGLAQDDQLIDQIRIQIGTDTEKTILQLTDGKMKAVGTNQAYAVETLHWKTGHTVEWAYVWDTEKEPANPGNRGATGGGPLSPVTVQVRVIDKNDPQTSDDRSANTNSAPFPNSVTVDIVPYITGFERETPTFSTKRSLQGWYSFYQGEQNIALRGYNLGQTPGNVTVSISSGDSGGTTTNMTGLAYNGGPDNTKYRFYFTVPTTAASGRINVSVGSTAAHNHTSKTTNTDHNPTANPPAPSTRSWNTEYNSYTPGSDLWINRPHAHIWRTADDSNNPRTYIGTTSGAGGSSGLDHPGMALEYTGSNAGTLHGIWAVYGEANTVYGTNANSGNLLYDATPGEPYGTPDISIFQGGGASAANVGLVHQTDGRPRLVVKATVSRTNDNNTPNANTQINDGNADGTTMRWQNVRISKALANGSGDYNVGRIYMTAFNGDTKGLWFGMRDGTTNTTMFIDGTRMDGNSDNTTRPPYITDSGIARTSNAGEYNAVDYDNVGPIIAYYDNNTVRIAFGTTLTPTTSQWTRRYLLPEGHPLRTGSGQHISIKVDRLNGIHLAFYNSARTTVVYYYAKDRSYINVATPPNPDTIAVPNPNVKCHTIDNVVTGGIRTDISIHEEDGQMLPWIVYGDSSRTNNYDGVRVAYKSGASDSVEFDSIKSDGKPLTCAVTGANIAGWEALTMPAQYTVNNDRLNIEAWPPTVRGGTLGNRPAGTNWDAAIGYASDLYRVGYFYYPKWKGY